MSNIITDTQNEILDYVTLISPGHWKTPMWEEKCNQQSRKTFASYKFRKQSYPKHNHFWEGNLQVTDRRNGQETWTGTSHSHSTEVHSELCPERRVPSIGTRKMPINVIVMLLYSDQNWWHWNSWQYWVLDHDTIGYNMDLHNKIESAGIISIHIYFWPCISVWCKKEIHFNCTYIALKQLYL